MQSIESKGSNKWQSNALKYLFPCGALNVKGDVMWVDSFNTFRKWFIIIVILAALINSLKLSTDIFHFQWKEFFITKQIFEEYIDRYKWNIILTYSSLIIFIFRGVNVLCRKWSAMGRIQPMSEFYLRYLPSYIPECKKHKYVPDK